MMSDQELAAAASRLKEDGNEKFKAQKHKQAEGHYKDALAHAEKCRNESAELTKLKVTCLQNMSVCTNNTEDYRETIRNCTKALDIDPKATKAYYLRSVANLKLAELAKASEDIKEAIKLAPSQKNLRDHFELVKAEKAKVAAKKKAQVKAFFSEGIYNEKTVKQNFNRLPDFDPESQQTYFDVEIQDSENDGAVLEKGRVVFELFNKVVPKTAENFRVLCTGENTGEGLHYKGNAFHRIISGFMMQGGDTTMGNGTGGRSIYGEKFEDEGVWLPHTHKGILSMANAGPNTNGSQFFVCYGPTPHLDGKHTIYGRVISGFDICEKAADVEKLPQDKPKNPVKIVDCGELTGDDKLAKEACDFLATYD